MPEPDIETNPPARSARGREPGTDLANLPAITRLPVMGLERFGDLVYVAIGAMLMVIALFVLARTAIDFVDHSGDVAVRVTDGVNGVLFVIIIMELLETVLSHFTGEGFQLQPFLIIGIISAVRHILTVGARLSLVGEGTNSGFQRAQIELGVNAGVVLALGIALILVRRSGPSQTD